ncbi:MAG: sodium/solute symporter [Kiritimatiellia bacterium]|jgi:SSS family transporter|nr:sodium/solute symporter [Pseudomonadales bacterium]MDP6490361.1 sodium/solute symporter [Kiritimatiellia bacterium]MDP6809513.1 sodium/solute symporter [Kiritimatiellia bacterium]MDP7022671.1 sodium/solute symporter [Kiritimatiellia bacterium]
MTFGTINYVVLTIYLLGMLAIGLFFARRQRTSEDYFLAGRNMPWLPVAMSMFASVTSAVTFMGVPAISYNGNVALLAACVVSPLVLPVLVYVLYPIYRSMRATTSYEYIGMRFGSRTRYAVSMLFVLARLGWMGTVIYAPAVALTVATGLPQWVAILLMGSVATLYTVMGGLAAVLWTDLVQFVILVAGAVWVAVALIHAVPGGIAGVVATTVAAGKADVWGVSLGSMSILAVAVSFYLSMLQEYGTDQVTVQRLLAVRTNRGVTNAAMFNAGTDFVMIALLTFIGLGLFAFYGSVASLPSGVTGKSILPYYIMTALPPGVSGLVISAVFAAAMSSMDSGINSLVTVMDNEFVVRMGRKAEAGGNAVSRARALTLLLGVAATGLAFYAAKIGDIIEAFFTFMSLFNAPVLALFILGVVSSRARAGAWLVGAAVSIPCTLWLQSVEGVHWVYYFPFSFTCTYALGWCVSVALPERKEQAHQ